MALEDDIERFRQAALAPIHFELDVIQHFTNYVRMVEEARQRGADALLSAFERRQQGEYYDPPPLSPEPNLTGPWPQSPLGYPANQPAGYGQPQQPQVAQGYPYAPPPPPSGYGPNGEYPPQQLAKTPLGDVLDRAHPGARRPR